MVQELKALRSAQLLNLIFDVGAAVGDTVRMFCKEFPEAEIYAFEPLTASYLTLLDRTRNQADRIHYFKCAVGDKNGQAVLNICSYPDASSINKLAPMLFNEGKTQLGTETVKLVTLDEITAQLPYSAQIDLLKIDVEGTENLVLKGAEETLKRTQNIYVELQPRFWGKGSTQHIKVFTLLNVFGFEFIGNYGDYWFSRDPAVLKEKF